MFGDIIRKLRKTQNLNQVQLATALNVSKQTVSNWENNNIMPSVEMLQIASSTGHLCHIRRTVRDIISGQAGTL